MKIITVLITFGTLLLISASSNAQTERSARAIAVSDSLQKVKHERDKKWIEEQMNDPTIYFGQATVNIGNDYGKALASAKNLALGDLAQQIETTVKGTLISVISEGQNVGGSGQPSGIEQFTRRRVEEYTHPSSMTNLKPRYFTDFPLPGNLTYCVSVSKAAYDRKVKEDLENRLASVTTPLEKGNSEFRRHNYMVAFNDWDLARDMLDELFPDVPVRYDCDNNDSLEDIGSYLQTRVNGFFGSVQLSFLDSNITYDASGQLTHEPMVMARYYENDRNSSPVSNLPISVGFVNGTGRPLANFTTSVYGQVGIPITVDGSNKSTVISVSIDTSRIKGIGDFQFTDFPSARLSLEKIKAIGVILSSAQLSNESIQSDVSGDVYSILDEAGFQHLKAVVSPQGISRSLISQLNAQNADFVILVKISVHSANNIGGIKNMWLSSSSGYISLYKLPEGNEIRRLSLSTTKGFGVSAASSAWAAYDKLKKSIEDKVTTLVGIIQ